MIKKTIIIFFILTSIVSAQSVLPIQKEVIDADVYWGFDAYKNIYYTKNDVLYKKNETNVVAYQNLGFGKIEKIDFSNPLLIIVFYKNFNAVVLLDNQLNEVTQILFSQLENPLVVAQIGLSGQNELWFYDELTQKIGLINNKSKEVQFISNAVLKPIKTSFSTYNYWYWIDENRDLFCINRFGSISKLGTLAAFENLWFTDENIIVYNYQSKIYGFNIKNSTFRELNFDIQNVKNLYYKNEILSLFTGYEVTNYQLNFE